MGWLPDLLFILGLVAVPTAPASAQDVPPGILDRRAPRWSIEEWIHLPGDASRLDLTDFSGKVIYLYCFQSWCPGCHRHGFPTLEKVISRYGHDPDVAIVAVQTTFEGFGANGFDNAREVAERYHLSIPIGQSGYIDRPSELMARYRTGGTPWVIIIGRDGVVRYNGFHIEPEQALRLIGRLKSSPRPLAPQKPNRQEE